MKPQFFGQSDQTLFGVYHRALGADVAPAKAVVICPPIGQEYVRTHWCLRSLAGQLARRGIHVLRFDYFGIGDSSGSVESVMSLDQWQRDTEESIRRLIDESGARSVMLFGLRSGATIASTLSGIGSVNSLMYWEPVWSGQDLLNCWGNLHLEMLDMRKTKMETENSIVGEEILGSLYSHQLLKQMQSWSIDWESVASPQFVFDLKKYRTRYEKIHHPLRKIELYDDEDSWSDLNQMETAWLRPKMTRKIVTQVADTFERLQKFGILDPQPSELQGVS